MRGTLRGEELIARARDAVGGPTTRCFNFFLKKMPPTSGREIYAGAEAVVCGTRFLDDRGARRPPALQDAPHRGARDDPHRAVRCRLPAAHRVIPNEATAGWLRRDPRGPGWLRMLHRATAPLASRAPVPMQIASPLLKSRAVRCSAPPLRSPAVQRTGQGRAALAGQCIDRIGTSALRASSSASWPPRTFEVAVLALPLSKGLRAHVADPTDSSVIQGRNVMTPQDSHQAGACGAGSCSPLDAALRRISKCDSRSAEGRHAPEGTSCLRSRNASVRTANEPPLEHVRSCLPPLQTASAATVGTPDMNGFPSQSEATVRIDVIDAVTTADDDSLWRSPTSVSLRRRRTTTNPDPTGPR